jgi:hypothetical protein
MKKQLLMFCLVAFAASKIATAQYFLPISKMDVPHTVAAITMDATADASYGPVIATTITKEAGAGITPYKTTEDVAGDFGSMFRLCWDETYLYLYAEVTDDIEQDYVRGAANSWTWDNFEAFLDLDTNSDPALQNVDKVQLRFNRGLKDAADADSMVESAGGNVTAAAYLFSRVDAASDLVSGYPGWKFEVAIPWAAAVSGEISGDMTQQKLDVIGFDIGIADADGDQVYPDVTEGGRNVAGGSQAFWDLDDPAGTGNEDNGYQNRRCYGFITLKGGSGIDVINTTSSVNVYPNPSTGIVNLTNLDGLTTVEIYNMVGVKVKSVEVTNNQINVADLQTGVYVVKANNYSFKLTKN